jgi:IPT/TIG domain
MALPISVQIQSPTGGETVHEGTSLAITWFSNGASGQRVQYSLDGGNNFTAIVTGLDGSVRSYSWTIPKGLVPAGQASIAMIVQVTVKNTAGNSVSSASGPLTLQPAAPAPAPAPVINSVTPSSGSTNGGTQITISGANFQPGVTAKLGGTALAVSYVSSSQLTAVTPAEAAGAVNLRVVNPDTQFVVAQNVFTFSKQAAPAPVVSGVSPAGGPVAGGTPITISGANFQVGATAKLGGKALTVTYVSASKLTATTPSGTAGATSLLIMNPDGQSASGTFMYTGGVQSQSSGFLVYFASVGGLLPSEIADGNLLFAPGQTATLNYTCRIVVDGLDFPTEVDVGIGISGLDYSGTSKFNSCGGTSTTDCGAFDIQIITEYDTPVGVHRNSTFTLTTPLFSPVWTETYALPTFNVLPVGVGLGVSPKRVAVTAGETAQVSLVISRLACLRGINIVDLDPDPATHSIDPIELPPLGPAGDPFSAVAVSLLIHTVAASPSGDGTPQGKFVVKIGNDVDASGTVEIELDVTQPSTAVLRLVPKEADVYPGRPPAEFTVRAFRFFPDPSDGPVMLDPIQVSGRLPAPKVTAGAVMKTDTGDITPYTVEVTAPEGTSPGDYTFNATGSFRGQKLKTERATLHVLSPALKIKLVTPQPIHAVAGRPFNVEIEIPKLVPADATVHLTFAGQGLEPHDPVDIDGPVTNSYELSFTPEDGFSGTTTLTITGEITGIGTTDEVSAQVDVSGALPEIQLSFTTSVSSDIVGNGEASVFLITYKRLTFDGDFTLQVAPGSAPAPGPLVTELLEGQDRLALRVTPNGAAPGVYTFSVEAVPKSPTPNFKSNQIAPKLEVVGGPTIVVTGLSTHATGGLASSTSVRIVRAGVPDGSTLQGDLSGKLRLEGEVPLRPPAPSFDPEERLPGALSSRFSTSMVHFTPKKRAARKQSYTAFIDAPGVPEVRGDRFWVVVDAAPSNVVVPDDPPDPSPAPPPRPVRPVPMPPIKPIKPVVSPPRLGKGAVDPENP